MKGGYIKELILDLLYPQMCITCGSEGSLWCSVCLKKYTYQPIQKCVVCKKISERGRTHRTCKRFTHLDYFIRFGKYSSEIKKIIAAYKFEGIFSVSESFKDLYLQLFVENESLLGRAGFIVPVPSHSSRLRTRGFDHINRLATELSSVIGVPVLNVLDRRKKTGFQNKLSKSERLANMEESFVLSPSCRVTNESTAVILDDIATTGATLHEAAKVLHLAGVRNIIAVVIARGI